MYPAQDRKWTDLSLKQEGINAVPIFKMNLSSIFVSEEIRKDPDKAGFEKTTNQVFYRKIQTKNEVTGYQVMHQGELSMARNTGEYLNEALRGINLQVRDIMSDIVALNKLLFKRQTEAYPNAVLK